MSYQYHVINDPVHGPMQFGSLEDSWIKPFIDSPHFQRLRQIKQLGLADWIFPGALHSRFSHGLGVCYIVSQICNKLGVDNENKQLLIIAGLLHDLGHGPFSHLFEELCVDHAIKHERWTAQFLQSYADSDFLKTYNERNPDYPLTPKKIKQVQSLITHSYEGNKLFSDMISSQLDADRLDYLLRDSHFCGVTYGTYEFRWLLHCLTIIKHEGQERLGITRKGVGVVEEYVMARRLMMRNIYHHGKKIGAEFLMQQFLNAVAKSLQEPSSRKRFRESALIQFLEQMNAFNLMAVKEGLQEKHVVQFLQNNFHLYQQLCDYDVLQLIRDLAMDETTDNVTALAKRLHHRILPKVIPVADRAIKEATNLIHDFEKKHTVEDWQLRLMSLPHQSYSISEDPILLVESTGAVKSLHTESLMIDALSDKHENHYLVVFDTALLQTEAGELLYNLLRDL